jgi:hypothetical protein
MTRPGSEVRSALKFDSPGWGLPDAQCAAAEVLAHPELLKVLLRALFSNDPALRHRAADTARRVTEKQPELLTPHAERLLGLFSESAEDNWRTRAHLGLVVARVAASRAHRLRAAGLLRPLYYDPSNVVRCTAIEGLGLLAHREPSMRREVEALLEEVLRTGTLAMRNRAGRALELWSARRSARRSGIQPGR